jgi:hypothetical protein
MLQSYLLTPPEEYQAVDTPRSGAASPDALTFKEITGDCKPKRRR